MPARRITLSLSSFLVDALLCILTGYALVSSYVIAVLACRVRDLSEDRANTVFSSPVYPNLLSKPEGWKFEDGGLVDPGSFLDAYAQQGNEPIGPRYDPENES